LGRTVERRLLRAAALRRVLSVLMRINAEAKAAMTVKNLLIFAVLLWRLSITWRWHKLAHLDEPPLSALESRVRWQGSLVALALLAAVYLAFAMAPRPWVQAHPRVLVGAMIMPVASFLGFVALPGLSRWVARRLAEGTLEQAAWS
jgi:hypothetical protein